MLARGLVGRYVVRKRSATIQEVPLFGDTPTVNTSYGLVTIEMAGDYAFLKERYCRSTSTSESSIVTTIPESVPRSMGEFHTKIAVHKEGDHVRWTRDARTHVMGATLENPTTDALPTTVTDSRVFDQDEDGHPGITVKIEGFVTGEIYLVQRQTDTYEGTVAPDGTISGFIKDVSEQSIIDASNPVLKMGAPSRPDPDTSKSDITFIGQSEDMDCDRLVASLEGMFIE